MRNGGIEGGSSKGPKPPENTTSRPHRRTPVDIYIFFFLFWNDAADIGMAAETYIMRKPHGRLSLVALAGNVIYLGFRVQGPRDRHTPVE